MRRDKDGPRFRLIVVAWGGMLAHVRSLDITVRTSLNEQKLRIPLWILQRLHLFLEQPDGLPAVEEDSSRTKAATYEGPIGLRKEDGGSRLADGTIGSADLSQRGFESHRHLFG